MDKEYSTELPKALIEAMKANRASQFRRRAILSKGSSQWELVCCTVEGFLPGETLPSPTSSRRYPKAVLFEDFLTSTECMDFTNELRNGETKFGDIELKRSAQGSQWTVELVPVSNDYMNHAGSIVGFSFGGHGGRTSVRTLLAADQPYYPNIDEAARDWLPFPTYHGHSDSRNDHVLFLLPESRAFIAEASFSDEGTLAIVAAGSEVERRQLFIKGAYWIGKVIQHVSASLINGKADIPVPADADSLECYLIDQEGTTYDFHREDRFSQLQKGRKTLGSVNRTLADQVRSACRSGEGMHVEFKPFIHPADVFSANKQKTKLLEIIITVVAFANTAGGHLYLGIEDDCSISGVDDQLKAWVKGPLNEENIARYLGTLKSRIKESIYGEVVLRLSHVNIDGATVIMIEVPEAPQKPVAIHQDRHLYVRAGASSQKAPPELWRSILLPNGGGIWANG